MINSKNHPRRILKGKRVMKPLKLRKMSVTTINRDNYLGRILKEQRVMKPLSLKELAVTSGASPSHIWRIEKGERFPSARLLHKLAEPLGFTESELLLIAGYLSHRPPIKDESREAYTLFKGLNPYVAAVLSREPADVQRTILSIVSILKYMAKGIAQESSDKETNGTADKHLF